MTKITFNKKTGALSALSAALILAVIIPSIPFASADDTTCIGVLAPGAYANVNAPGPSCFLGPLVTVNGDVKHTGGFLSISGATINGNVQSEGAISLSIRSATINGNVQSDGTAFVNLSSASVGGDVQIKGATSTVNVRGGSVGGNVQIEEMTGGAGSFIVVGFPTVTIGGDLQLIKNTQSPCSFLPSCIFVGGNTVGGNLQCKENSPAPNSFGTPNTVTGLKEDQCSAALGF